MFATAAMFVKVEGENIFAVASGGAPLGMLRRSRWGLPVVALLIVLPRCEASRSEEGR
ncbi:hypothetical protein SAMN05216338_1001175 [Bradyrhizobium sp. Rc2d]|uniref:hypothetical protein n=1 Tax=Bradyrhizobium sp. Rc2d TaxID=1855321 RepID=UPI00087F3D23|nr:hypothetical protein [Bradyrhizobium sp. Rc2d]SDG40351.1 hypothetical protein SAMN05216338_1001175 [Bradyrhizobium sp. Rc2d]